VIVYFSFVYILNQKFRIFVINHYKSMALTFIPAKDSIKGYSESKLAQSETRDCVVRAFASALDWDYNKAHRFVATEFLRQPKSGTMKFIPTMNQMVQEGRKLGRKSIKPITDPGIKTVGQFVKWYDKGTYIVVISRHAFTIKDGQVVGGNWNDAERMRCRIKAVWKIG
jgi:hypothetical protein